MKPGARNTGPLPGPFALPLCLATALLLVGCEPSESPDPTATAIVEEPAAAVREPAGYSPDEIAGFAFGTREQLRARVEALTAVTLASTAPATLELAGRPVEGRAPIKRQMAVPTPLPLPQAPLVAPPPPGAVVATLDDSPRAMAVGNAGDVVYTTGEATWWVPPGEAAPRSLAPAEATSLQWDASGERLLVQLPGEVRVYTDLGGEPMVVGNVRLFGEDETSGRASWLADDALLFVREAVDFNASSPERIFLDNAAVELDGETRVPLTWTPFRKYSSVGTLPTAGLVWGIPLQRFRIRPMPATIVEIDADGNPGRILAERAGHACFAPVASTAGDLVYLAAPRYGSHATRAWWRSLNDEESPVMITSHPTAMVTVAPGGDWFAVAVRVDETVSIHRWSRPEHDAVLALGPTNAARLDWWRGRAAMMDMTLRRAFDGLPVAAGANHNDIGWLLATPPTSDDFAIMGAAFQTALASAIGTQPGVGMTALSNADALLDEVSPFLTETPWLLMGTAGFFATHCGVEGEWFLEEESIALGMEVLALVHTDEVAYTAINVPGLARERITSDVPLTETARRVLGETAGPYFFVENLRDDTLNELVWKQVEESGVMAEGRKLAELAEQLRDGPVNGAVHRLAAEAGRTHDFAMLELVAAMRLAEGAPASSEALLTLARSLKDQYLPDEALLVYDAAIPLVATDPTVHIERADVLLLLGRHAEAREALARAALMDPEELVTDVIAGRLRLVDEAATAAAEDP